MLYFSIALLVFFLATIFFVLWLWWRMRASKARFCLAVLSSLLTLAFTYTAYASVGLPVVLISMLAKSLNLEIPSLTNGFWANFICAMIVLVMGLFIYRFAKTAVENWDGPRKVTEAELELKGNGNSLLLLAYAEAERILLKTPDYDAPGSDERDGKRQTPAPESLKDHVLLRDLFLSYRSDAEISDDAWRVTPSAWLGGIHQDLSNEISPLILIVFPEKPAEEQLVLQFKSILDNQNPPEGAVFFGVYQSDGVSEDSPFEVTVGAENITILSSRYMLFNSLDFRKYARNLRSSFYDAQVGGTNAKLSDTYVDLLCRGPDSEGGSVSLFSVVRGWLKERSRKHLAITGEYGQGKSTAMQKYCADWAVDFLKTGSVGERVPLLIELRGRDPASEDPVRFLSGWCSQHALDPNSVYNLIKSGDAVVIFEGFDELRNSGRPYFRHEHFNKLWRFAYPGVKVIFTGRPNFFLDDIEANATLRASTSAGAAGEAYTECYRLEKLNTNQITTACQAFEASVRDGMLARLDDDGFREIVSRPSMLPVVATIWNKVGMMENTTDGDLTGAGLIQEYIRANFLRKEAELEQDKFLNDAPESQRYLVLPMSAREMLTICVAWNMAKIGGQNTISRSEIRKMIRLILPNLVAISKSGDASLPLSSGLKRFWESHAEETDDDLIEIITHEICSAGLLIPDPVGGISNLKFPHKQFYEYLVALAFVLSTHCKKSSAADLINRISGASGGLEIIHSQPGSIDFLVDFFGRDLSGVFGKWTSRALFCFLLPSAFLLVASERFLNFLKIKNPFDHLRMGALDFGGSSIRFVEIVSPALLVALLMFYVNLKLSEFIENSYVCFSVSFAIVSVSFPILRTFGRKTGGIPAFLATYIKRYRFKESGDNKELSKIVSVFEATLLLWSLKLRPSIGVSEVPHDLANLTAIVNDFGPK